MKTVLSEHIFRRVFVKILTQKKFRRWNSSAICGEESDGFQADVVCGIGWEKREIDICSDSLVFLVQSSAKLDGLIILVCDSMNFNEDTNTNQNFPTEFSNAKKFHAFILSRDEAAVTANYFIRQFTI